MAELPYLLINKIIGLLFADKRSVSFNIFAERCWKHNLFFDNCIFYILLITHCLVLRAPCSRLQALSYLGLTGFDSIRGGM